MPDAKGGEKVAGRKEIHPGIIVDQINKELLKQRGFGKTWGVLVAQGFPTTLAEEVALKKKELAQLEEAGVSAPSVTTTSRAEFSSPTNLEAGLKGSYRSLKAGV
jgi:hypothetical protein